MYRDYVDNFLKKTNASYVERYSDSSDFEYPTNIPRVTAKRGNHGLLSSRDWHTNDKEYPQNVPTLNNNSQRQKGQLDKGSITKRFQKMMAHNQTKEVPPSRSNRHSQKISHDKNYYKNRGDQSSRQNIEKNTSKSILRDKVLPRISTIFRKSNYTRQIASIEEHEQIIVKNNDEKYCEQCERRRMKKYNKKRSYAIQPYAVVGNMHDAPIRYHQTVTKNSPSQNSITRTQSNTKCLTSSSGSDIVQERPRNTTVQNNKMKNKKLQYEYAVLNCGDYPQEKKHKHLQYPSKHVKPYHVYTNTSCQAKNQSGNSIASSKVPSSSSSFWEYVAERIKSKKACPCKPPPPPSCTLDSCEVLNSPKLSVEPTPIPPKPKKKSSPVKMKTPADCKCTKSEFDDQDNGPMSCQEPHDVITQNIAEKYQGQILCIHNPPCILINGCLNLPPPKSSGVANVWRLSQSKRSTFREENKANYTENASQYQPPCSLPDVLPEFQTEKFVQSICNHNPPCEVVHGCYKPKYDAKLRDSCVHVPMCQKMPECMVNEGQAEVQNVGCSHNPKCAEVPLCSKKFLVLTAREDTSTQVNPRAKMVCRHEPPCLMIPKCIARVICSDSVPYDAIPDCVHHPCCELIPACCRKAAKEMPSLTSNEEGISLRLPRVPLQQKNRLLRLIQAKRQY